MDIKEYYMQYADLVEDGEIDPKEISIEDFVTDKLSSLIDQARERMKDG